MMSEGPAALVSNSTEDSPPPPKKPAKSKGLRPPRRTCKFLIVAKNRFCSLLALKEQDFCAEHVTNKGLTPESHLFRVECPYNSNHTCFKRQLEQHMKRCNYRPVSPPPYFTKDINCISSEEEAGVIGKSLMDLNADELRQLVKKIEDVFNEHIPAIKTQAGSFELPEIKEHLSDPYRGKQAKRHVQQNASLLHLLDTAKLLMESTTFVEFGSGKGALTYWLAQALETKIESTKSCYLLLVDKESHRHKKENKLHEDKFNIERVRIDITDLKLDEITCVREAKSLIGICKHLCGSGTDVALRCLMETNSTASINLAGLVMATCCHHRCTWRTYVGTPFLLEWGIEEKDFRPLTCLTSWAVCGTGRSAFDDHHTDGNTVSTNMCGSVGLGIAERRILGYKAKQILDFGRCCFIRKYIQNAYLTTFVKYEDTLENIAIVALKTLNNDVKDESPMR